MSFLDTSDYKAEQAVEKDIVGGGGFKPLQSDVYDFKINLAYFSEAKTGTKAVNLELESEDTGKRRFTFYVTGQDGKIKYKDQKTGEMKYHSGFVNIDALCLLTVGKPLAQVQNQAEKKTINLYNWDQKQEVPTDVQMIMPLIGKTIKAAVEEKIENKSVKNQSTGKYEKTNEKRTVNNIVKFLRSSDSKTVNEIRGKVDATFITKWLEQWQGKPNDWFKEVVTPGNAGAPGGAFAGGAEPTGTTSDNLFLD